MVGQSQDRAGPRQGLGLPGYGLRAKTVVSSWERDGRWRLGDWDVGRLETGLPVCLSVCLSVCPSAAAVVDSMRPKTVGCNLQKASRLVGSKVLP